MLRSVTTHSPGALRIATIAAVLAAATVLLGALVATLGPASAAGATGRAGALPVTGRYVALGDSYTSGPLIPDQILSAGLCLRSNHDYPRRLAHRLGSAALADVSCSGATTDDLTATQFDALTPDTALVTVGIGGNDIGISGVVLNCAAQGLFDPWGSPCTGHYTSGGTDRIGARIRATGPKIRSVLAGIRHRAPLAKIVVVGYPDILPTSGDGCWPAVPFAAGDLPYLRSVEKRLNAMLARRATAGGATYVDTYRSSVGHDLCSDHRWIEGVIPTVPAAPIHPNSDGMANVAAQLATALGH